MWKNMTFLTIVKSVNCLIICKVCQRSRSMLATFKCTNVVQHPDPFDQVVRLRTTN